MSDMSLVLTAVFLSMTVVNSALVVVGIVERHPRRRR